VTYPSHFRSVVHDAVEDACAAHGFKPVAAHEVGETATPGRDSGRVAQRRRSASADARARRDPP
jgi:hypothetical protein